MFFVALLALVDEGLAAREHEVHHARQLVGDGAIRAGQATGDAKRNALVRFVSHLQTTSGTISQDEFTAIREAGYTDTQLAEISFAIALAIFTSTFNRINGTDVDFPAVE